MALKRTCMSVTVVLSLATGLVAGCQPPVPSPPPARAGWAHIYLVDNNPVKVVQTKGPAVLDRLATWQAVRPGTYVFKSYCEETEGSAATITISPVAGQRMATTFTDCGVMSYDFELSTSHKMTSRSDASATGKPNNRAGEVDAIQ